MNKDRLERVAGLALTVFGRDAQIAKAAEEMCELAAALLKFNNDRSPEALNCVVEEYVDVTVMMHQIDLALNLDWRATWDSNMFERKVKRLEGRVKKLMEVER